VLVTSRAYEEYVAFFDLDVDVLRGRRVLDCSAGASSFVARACREGVDAVAVDPAYAMGREELAEVAGRGLRDGNRIADSFPGRFTWSWYGSVQARERMRAQALAEFVLDLAEHPERYVTGSLPSLPFADGAFDLALCSHLLFTWADQLGRDWHLAALGELSRVAGEVRVFPTVVQGAGDPVPFWDALVGDLHDLGLQTRRRQVSYEFQVGADSMLVLTRPPA
jgi:SAM-dependent methyltransferase